MFWQCKRFKLQLITYIDISMYLNIKKNISRKIALNIPYNTFLAILSLNLIFHFCSYKNVSHLLFLNIDFISETNQSTRPIIVAAWPTSQPLPALFSPLWVTNLMLLISLVIQYFTGTSCSKIVIKLTNFHDYVYIIS